MRSIVAGVLFLATTASAQAGPIVDHLSNRLSGVPTVVVNNCRGDPAANDPPAVKLETCSNNLKATLNALEKAGVTVLTVSYCKPIDPYAMPDGTGRCSKFELVYAAATVTFVR